MNTALKIRPGVLAAKQILADGRAKLYQQHLAKSPGVQVCACLTDLLDEVLLQLYESALAELPAANAAELREQVALVANGGYGRRDVAPYSDVDLMILYAPAIEGHIVSLAKRLMHDVYDVGLMLGHSTRTPDQACQMAFKDATIFTSLVESRLVVGSQDLFDRYYTRFQRKSQRRWRSLFAQIDEARGEERQQYGETVYLLEPNVKRSQGSLRDIQLLRWVGFARYGEADPEALALRGELSKDEHHVIRDAREFLLRTRNELHFHSQKANDTLDRAEQVRIAEAFGYKPQEGLLPVEQFMREYFRHTQGISQLVNRFLARTRPSTRWLENWAFLFSHQVEGDFRVGPQRIYTTKRGLAKVQSDLAEVLRLTDLANLYNKRIAPRTWEAIHQAAPSLPDSLSDKAIERFLSLLSQPGRLGPLLRELHELGVLEKIVPGFAHARCLLQFNQYHKYTVDEHSFRAVEQCTQLLTDTGSLGRAYQSLKNKRMLHLALLIHDLGKGYPEDHSELGGRMAEELAARLKLPSTDTDTLKFLVRHHLAMAHLAFRRDTSDEQVILKFAHDCGSPEALQMLYVLTACDISAVGPGVWNDWKAEVLSDLYNRVMERLSGESPSGTQADRVAERQAAVKAKLSSLDDAPWFSEQIQAIPPHYLHGTAPEKIVEELRQLRSLQPGEVSAAGRWLPESKTVEFTVGTYEDITPGVFHKLCGALTGKGLQIHSAEINTLARGLIFDRFFVSDPDYAGIPPADRIGTVCMALKDSLLKPTGEAPTFRKVWKAGGDQPLSALPTQVRIDNGTSERCTIIDVFAHDRLGLLYTITCTLFELGLSVSLAKISTYLDQVADIFYVTDQYGGKVENESLRKTIRERLLAAIVELERT